MLRANAGRRFDLTRACARVDICWVNSYHARTTSCKYLSSYMSLSDPFGWRYHTKLLIFPTGSRSDPLGISRPYSDGKVQF